MTEGVWNTKINVTWAHPAYLTMEDSLINEPFHYNMASALIKGRRCSQIKGGLLVEAGSLGEVSN